MFQLASALVMIISLLWLTVNTPFANVVSAGLCIHGESTHNEIPSSRTEDKDPFGNTTEEKVPTSNTFSEEYLHHHHNTDLLISQRSTYHKLENSDTYIAYHGETLVPPPNSPSLL